MQRRDCISTRMCDCYMTWRMSRRRLGEITLSRSINEQWEAETQVSKTRNPTPLVYLYRDRYLIPLDARAELRSLVLSQYNRIILQHHQTHRRATVCQTKKTPRSTGGIRYEDEDIVQSANVEANGRIHP
jgi:hypothetical protein